jgi:uncharacterized protein (DUF433 family)
MASTSLSLSVPLSEDDDGTLRVSDTRVTLDTVVAAFDLGAAPEEIAQRFPTVPLADVYSVVSYYLQEPEKVRTYLGQRQNQALELRTDLERQMNTRDLRRRLLARRESVRASVRAQ